MEAHHLEHLLDKLRSGVFPRLALDEGVTLLDSR